MITGIQYTRAARVLQIHFPDSGGESRTVSAEVVIPESLPDDAWTLGFWLPQDNAAKRFDIRSAIRFENTTEWYDIGGRGINNLGTVGLISWFPRTRTCRMSGRMGCARERPASAGFRRMSGVISRRPRARSRR